MPSEQYLQPAVRVETVVTGRDLFVSRMETPIMVALEAWQLVGL
jgi:hypothetical protein